VSKSTSGSLGREEMTSITQALRFTETLLFQIQTRKSMMFIRVLLLGLLLMEQPPKVLLTYIGRLARLALVLMHT